MNLPDKNRSTNADLSLLYTSLAVTLDRLLNVAAHSDLVFRPLEPRVESGLDIVWKKYQVFSFAAELFLSRMRKQIASEPRKDS